MVKRERLEEWVKTLNNEQKESILVELTEFAIDAKYVNFPENIKVPYYDCTGDNIDGSVEEELNLGIFNKDFRGAMGSIEAAYIRGKMGIDEGNKFIQDTHNIVHKTNYCAYDKVV